MYYSNYSNSRPGSRYYPISSSSGYSRSRFDDDTSDQMEYLSSRHGCSERSHRAWNHSTHGGRSADVSRSIQATRSSRYGYGYISSQSSRDSIRIDHDSYHRDYHRVLGFSRSRAPTRASTVYPDDSISNTGRRPCRHRDARTRGRPVALVGHRSHRVFEQYPATLLSTSSREHSHSSRTFDSGPTYRYVPPTRGGEREPEVESNISSSSIIHPFAYDDSGRTRARHPPSRYQVSETSRRSRRSDAPPPESRAYYGQAVAGAYRCLASSRTTLPHRSVYGYPPPPTPVLRGRLGGNFSSISSDMEMLRTIRTWSILSIRCAQSLRSLLISKLT